MKQTPTSPHSLTQYIQLPQVCTVGSELLDVCVTHRPVGRKEELLQIREFACKVCEAACAALQRRTPTKIKFFQKLAAWSQLRDPVFSYVFTSPQIQTAKFLAFCSHHACYKVIVFNLQGKQTLGHVQHRSRHTEVFQGLLPNTHNTFVLRICHFYIVHCMVQWDLILKKTKLKLISYKHRTQLVLNSLNTDDQTASKVVSLKKHFFSQMFSPWKRITAALWPQKVQLLKNDWRLYLFPF